MEPIRLTADLRGIAAQLKGVDKAFAAALRREIRSTLSQAGSSMVERVRANAGWSSRIPGAVRLKTSFSVTRGSAEVVVDSKKAPEARPLEGVGGAATFRHPVYGNTDTWVEQPTHPFFAPAAEQEAANATRQMEDALDRIARAAGFH